MPQENMAASVISPPKDLKITTVRSFTLRPSSPTERRSMFLSNLDQVFNFHYKAVQFFSADPDFPFDAVVSKIVSSFERLLVPYDFMAGRLKRDVEGRLEIDCNAAGVSAEIAASERGLEELGKLYPDPALLPLTPSPEEGLADHDLPLFAFQMTRFKCGGHAFGVSMNHLVMDGLSYGIFFLNLAMLTSNKPLAITPCTDRRLLAARSPPRVAFSHPELQSMGDIQQVQSLSIMGPQSNGQEFKFFHLDPTQISALKVKAMAESAGNPTNSSSAVATSFNVVTAHLWKCKALAKHGPDENEISRLIYAVDIRQRLDPNVPFSYAGNAIMGAYAMATCRDLDVLPFSRVVELVSEGARRLTDEYIRSAIDWGEMHIGLPVGDVYVTSWWKIRFDDLKYGWGNPKSFCLLMNPKWELIMLFPREEGGVNVLVGLASLHMEKFQGLFYKDFMHHRL